MGELPSVSSTIVRKARVEHRCCECNETIVRGETYEIIHGCWEGKWQNFKTCTNCSLWRMEAYVHSYGDEGLAFGELSDWWSQGDCDISDPFEKANIP